MKEYLQFLKSGEMSNKKAYFNDFVISFLLVFTIKLSISILKGVCLDIPLIDKEDFENLNWKIFLSYIIVIPIIEEIIFRAPLLIPKAKFYSVLITIVLIFSGIIYIENEYFQLTFISLTLILEMIYVKHRRFQNMLNSLIQKNYLALVFLSSVSFGLLHMWNYDEINFLSFISVIGRIITGLYFAFIATKYGLISSYFLHGLNNVIPFLILLVAEK